MILKTLRLDRGLTQQALCEQIGVTKSVYARYEHKRRKSPADRLHWLMFEA